MAKREPFIFFRKEGFYIVEIPPDKVQENVDLNPGTLRVETISGKTVWRLQ